ncbi:MAG TPA: hypothetical protein VD838_17970 [Anaeromyxobacteraceae bacterium]|nr:hypothetical protein [Anaeromyxobacteraceae bacterium]
MSLHTALALSAFGFSVVLLLASSSRALPAIALVASGLEALMALGYVRVGVAGVPLSFALGLGIAIPGVLAWFRASGKTAIGAASIVAFIGVLQVVLFLGRNVG